MKHVGLFEGIGGFSLAAKQVGWQTIAWCEWNAFGQLILSHHYPKASQHGDITKTDFTIYRGLCDILTGGFPCQPYSVAGKRKGKDDERHLWPEMLRAVREIQPRWVVGENVRGIINWNGGMVFNEVQADLEAEGYEVLPFLLPAAGVNAPHERYRTWFVAYSSITRREKQHTTYESNVEGYCPGHGITNSNCWSNFPTQPPVCSGDDGLSTELLRQRIREDSMGFISEKEIDKIISKAATTWRNETIKAGGNAIVPQVFLQICKAIEAYEKKRLQTK